MIDRHETEHNGFRTPDETRDSRGRAELLSVGGGEVGRLVFEPGWRWSNDVKPIAGTKSCEAPHFQYHVSGRLAIRMDDGTEFTAEPGDVTSLPSGTTRGSSGTSPWSSSTGTARATTRRPVDAVASVTARLEKPAQISRSCEPGHRIRSGRLLVSNVCSRATRRERAALGHRAPPLRGPGRSSGRPHRGRLRRAAPRPRALRDRASSAPGGDRSPTALRARRPSFGGGVARDEVQGRLGRGQGAGSDRSRARGDAGTRRALEEGDISMSAARALVAARDFDASAFEQGEGQLVEAARIHAVGDLVRVVAYWRQAVERDRTASDEERIRQRRRLHASVSFLGMVRVDGDLDPETGETLLTALRAVTDAEVRQRGPSDVRDRRTPAQRRADALGEICRQWLDQADRPSVAGERPHVTVTVDARALAHAESYEALEPRDSSPPGESALTGDSAPSSDAPVCELDHTGPISPESARRFACDASVMRVVMSGRSEPLDVGRRTPIVSPAMRRAVIVRDRRCRFPGCDRPHTWCDAHHVAHWADGGTTAVHNLLLLCRRHHGMVHGRGGFRLRLEGGDPVFRRPDGSRVEEDRAPP